MSTDQSSKSSNKWIVILLVLLGLTVLMCGGPLTWWFARRSGAFAEVEKRRNEIRARGLPIDDDSMEAFRDQSMEHANSQRWMRVLDQASSTAFENSGSGIPMFGASEGEDAYVHGQPYELDDEVRTFLDHWTELRKEIHDITEESGAIWTAVEMDSFNTPLPHVQACRNVARLLSLEFEDALRREDRDRAYHSLLAMIGVARSLEKEPIIITQLVQIAVSGITLRQLKLAVELDLFDEKQLVSILGKLKALDDYGSRYRLAIAGERAMSQPIFDDLGRFGEEVGPLPSTLNERPIDALASLEVFEKAEQVDPDDITTFFTEVVALDDDFQQSITNAGWLRRLETVVTGLTAPALGAVGRAFVRSAMEIRIAKLGVGLRLYEKRSGRLPASLDELTAADLGVDLGPVDPVGGKPFGYQMAEKSAILWGFDPQQPSDATPPQPMLPSELAERREPHLKYWYWKLPGNESP